MPAAQRPAASSEAVLARVLTIWGTPVAFEKSLARHT
jgi:hypothetical protein